MFFPRPAPAYSSYSKGLIRLTTQEKLREFAEALCNWGMVLSRAAIRRMLNSNAGGGEPLCPTEPRCEM